MALRPYPHSQRASEPVLGTPPAAGLLLKGTVPL